MEATSGVRRIAEERERQITEEGWSPEHDDTHQDGQLAKAAACYASPPAVHLRELVWRESGTNPYGEFVTKDPWPWGRVWDKRPSVSASFEERIKALAKAGALCAAEIERLERKRAKVKGRGLPR